MADTAPQSPNSPGSDSSGPKPHSSLSPNTSPGLIQVQEAPKLNGIDSTKSKSTETKTGTEDLKESEESSTPEEDQEDPLSPDLVVCDCCLDSPRRAVKSCLTCLVSYCEVHLRPHLENPKFQMHRLLDPLRDIDRKTCEVHHLPLDHFCLLDQVCVCQDCLQEDHQGHEQTNMDQARRTIEEELKHKQSEMLETVAAAEKAIEKLLLNTTSIEKSVMEVRAVIKAQFEVLSGAVDRTKREVTEVLEAEERQALKQAEGIRAHLQNRCSELRKTQSQVQRISRNKNHVDFLQEYSKWRQEAADVSLPGINIGLMDCLNSFSRVIVESTEELCHMMTSHFTKKVKEACSNDQTEMGIKNTVQAVVAATHMSLPDPETRADLLKYLKSVSFDGNTAHKFLRLTEENRKVTNTTPWQHPYPEHPERFEHWRQVLALESIYLNRGYFEVDFSGEGTYLGVSYKSLERKGVESNSCISSTNSSWCLQWTGRAFLAWHHNVETPLSAGRFTRLGVYVDYTGGLLRFYGFRPETGDEPALIHEYRAKFMEPLYPAFWLSKKENMVTLVAPGEPLGLKKPSPPTSPLTSRKSGTPPSGTPPNSEQ